MDKILLIIAFGMLFGCTTNKTEKSDYQDTLEDLEIERQAREKVDSIMLNVLAGDFDKAKAKANECPIVVTKSYIKDGEYGISKYVHITIKNTGEKTVDAIKFIGLYTNNWGEKVANNIVKSAYSYLDLQETLRPGKTISGRADLSHDGATKVEFVVTKIHFTDNTLWEVEGIEK